MGKKIGDFYITDHKLGQGQFGEVYEGENKATGQKVAAKMIPKRIITSRIEQCIKAQVNIMSALIHPNIVRLFDSKASVNNTYIFLEFCEGGDLQRYLKERGPPSLGLFKIWAVQLIEAFRLLHSRHIMHRDVKLANILLSDASDCPDIKLADFGLSKELAAESTGTKLGTPMFMAPEILQDKEYDYKADVWSLGVVFYYLTVGKSPFDCNSISDLKKLQSQVVYPAHLDSGLKDLLAKMLSVSVETRSSIDELAGHPFLAVQIHQIVDLPDKSDRKIQKAGRLLFFVQEILKTCQEFLGTSQLLKAVGFAQCALTRINSLTLYIASARYKYSLQTNEELKRCQKDTEKAYQEALFIFRRMQTGCRAEFDRVVVNYHVRQVWLNQVLDAIKEDIQRMESGRAKFTYMIVVLVLERQDQWTNEEYQKELELYAGGRQPVELLIRLYN